MVFTSTTFVFVFLPLAVVAFYVFPARWRVVPLLLSSAVFYGWGEPSLVLLVLAVSVVTYFIGRALASDRLRARRLTLTLGIVVVLAPLVFLKYSEFIAGLVGWESWAEATDLPLPIGVSFYTFMAIGYLVDVYRRAQSRAPRLLDFSAYMLMFPHLVAGPIVRWSHVGPQLRSPRFHPGMFGFGAVLVATGLAKKTVIADSLAPLVDTLFGTGEPGSVGGAWLAVILYAGQIYFDFSAYSDIAIGLAAMLGVHFHDNFRYPYTARSAADFWRKWHISLGMWFRDYVYIPLGGSRVRPALVWRNLMIVWALTGLWHGAAWTFVVWGLYYGVLIGLERFVWGSALARMPRVVQHGYGLLVVLLGWVFFRAESLEQAGSYFATMFAGRGVGWWDPLSSLTLSRSWVLIAVSIVLAAGAARPLMDRLRRQTMPTAAEDQNSSYDANDVPPERITAGTSLLMVLLVVGGLALATAFLVAVSYSPFIYFRF